MVRIAFCLAAVALLGATIACTQAPPDTREADVRAIRATEAEWAKETPAKDVDKFVSYYTDDASLLLPNMPIVSGKDAIRGTMKAMLADPNFSLDFHTTRAEASKGGDLVYTQGTFTMTSTDPNTKKPATDKGKYLTVWKKQADGSWKAVMDMSNSDLPLASARQ